MWNASIEANGIQNYDGTSKKGKIKVKNVHKMDYARQRDVEV